MTYTLLYSSKNPSFNFPLKFLISLRNTSSTYKAKKQFRSFKRGRKKDLVSSTLKNTLKLYSRFVVINLMILLTFQGNIEKSKLPLTHLFKPQLTALKCRGKKETEVFYSFGPLHERK